ncbi:rhamnosidase [Alteromonas aestuariivivens]|uniref:alpha-L-rhamnosidase n=1 Tax=Alteromonas aestuariivivens TaxID=1938339 RepID=A0A3D8M811_9ALTE|nr:alpha-L-rhamnosidase [Alteromonas aestuariivivens]RDV25667.1 rhamnosidase [Alteromonas aestuariivivens]
MLPLLWLAACTAQPPASQAIVEAPVKLKLGEGFSSPIGYYESTPRFSWLLPQQGQSDFQTAYQIQVSGQTFTNADTAADLWDSGKVFSSQTSWLDYQGKPLKSRQKAYWRVRYWNEQQQASDWSDTQEFELGLLDNTDWQGKWIGHPDTALLTQPTKEILATPQYLRKTFRVNRPVKQARLYVTAKGVFKPFINGNIVAPNDVMTPGWTPYQRRIETLTYDITENLTLGENTLAASLAGGWYSGRIANLMDIDHKLPPRFLAQLEIVYQDGSSQTIVTDESWKSSQAGPIRFASNYDGERYDQAMEMPGWNAAGFDDASWQAAISEPLDPQVLLRPKRHDPIRMTQTLPAVSVEVTGPGVAVFDFGQNMVGVPHILVPAIAGQPIRIRFAEALHKGEFYTDNYRSAHSTDYYLPAKTGQIEYQPTFTFHGYRYMEVSGFDSSQAPSTDWANALVQHSDIRLYNNFSSSSAKLNQLSQNVVWGMRSNFYDIPLDCPQRDERLGWTGDANAFLTPSMYMADAYGFWSAWLQSVREEQNEQGMVPLYIPYVKWITWASSGWGDAATIIPWELYQLTGDLSILQDNYAMMLGWLDYHKSQSENHISHMKTFGDWLQPYPVSEAANRGDTDFSLISTAFYARSVQLTAKTAQALGKTDKARQLTELHSDIKAAFLAKFFDDQLLPKSGHATQTTYLLGLAFELFPTGQREIALNHLLGLLKASDNHLRTGFLGTSLLASVLQDAGRSDLIYDLLFKETYPSWFYSINNGATTTWERWNSYSLEDGFNPQGMNSLNHYAYGTISRWFYEGILGVTPAEPGFKRISIAPQFNQRLSAASGQVPTPNGPVSIDWKITNQTLILDVTIPRNTEADLSLPDVMPGTVTVNGTATDGENFHAMSPGRYRIEAKLSNI